MPSLTSGIRPVLTSGARRPAHVGRAACNCRSLPRSRQGAVSRIRATARRLSVRVRMDGSRSVFRPQRTPHWSAAVEGAAAHRTINVGRFITRRGFLIRPPYFFVAVLSPGLDDKWSYKWADWAFLSNGRCHMRPRGNAPRGEWNRLSVSLAGDDLRQRDGFATRDRHRSRAGARGTRISIACPDSSLACA